MKTKILFFAMLVMGACIPVPNGDDRKETADNYSIVTIESCEYIEYDKGVGNYRVYSLTHKGNCKNPIHNCK